MADDNRGWHGDPQGHAQAGSQSSGNKNAADNLDDQARSKGGSMSSGNFKNQSKEDVEEAARKGGQS
jgi:general stress protein YciG